MRPEIKMRLANKGRGEFRAEAGTIWLYDFIAADDTEAEWWGGISPRQFIAELRAIDGPVTLRIDSPGGSVFGAQAMIAAMREHPHAITARIDSLAASAASVIAVEAAKVEMVSGAMMMIHRASGVAWGNDDDMRAMAALLEKIDGQIAAAYARRGGDDTDWRDLMSAESWFTAEEAVEIKLADRVITESTQRTVAARWDLSAFSKVPQQAPAPAAPPPGEPEPPVPDSGAHRARLLAARLAASPI